MKKIKPVCSNAVFTTLSKNEDNTPDKIRKELIHIISKQISNYT